MNNDLVRNLCLRVVRGAFSVPEWNQLVSDAAFQNALAAAARLDQAENLIRVGLERLDTQERAEESARRHSDLLQRMQVSLSERLARLAALQKKPPENQVQTKEDGLSDISRPAPQGKSEPTRKLAPTRL